MSDGKMLKSRLKHKVGKGVCVNDATIMLYWWVFFRMKIWVHCYSNLFLSYLYVPLIFRTLDTILVSNKF